MAGNTEHYSLIKPEQGEYYNVDDFNENADILDAAVYAAKLKADKAEKKSIVIAAQNSAADFKLIADFICGPADQSAFQGAADRAVQTGGTVYIAPGDYEVDMLDAEDDVVFEGIGEVNIETGERSFFISWGDCVLKNLRFTGYGVYLKPNVSRLMIENCRFEQDGDSCIKIDGNYVQHDIRTMISITNSDFVYTGDEDPTPLHNFIFYVNDSVTPFDLTVTNSRCNIKHYLVWGIDWGNNSVVRCAGCVNISAMEPRTGTAAINAGSSFVTKDVSKAWDNAERNYRYEPDRFAYAAEVTEKSADVVIIPVFDIENKKVTFMLNEAAENTVTLSYRIVPVEI